MDATERLSLAYWFAPYLEKSVPHSTLTICSTCIQGFAPLDCRDIIPLRDPQMDETVMDISDNETLIFTQVDQFGQNHTVVLSPRMVAQALQALPRWKVSNTP